MSAKPVIPSRASWKHALAPYLKVDERRSLGQITSVVFPYLAIWILAAFIAYGRSRLAASLNRTSRSNCVTATTSGA